MKQKRAITPKSLNSLWQSVKEHWLPFVRRIPYVDVIIILTGTLLAIFLRYSLRTFQSHDYTYYYRQWYAIIKDQGFAALGQNFSDYTPLSLYLLYGVSVLLPKVASVTAVKLPSIACDFIIAWYLYRIVRLKYEKGPVPIFAFLAILFAPTVILNSAAWTQIESIYTAALVAFLYYLLNKKNWLACIAFGIAVSIKLQSIYLAPLLFILFLKKVVSWKHLLAIPAVYFISVIPAWIAGRPLGELLTIYVAQINDYTHLANNAPNMYTWLPGDMDEMLYPGGVLFAVSLCLTYVAVVFKSRVRLSKQLIVQLAFLSVLLVPYFLPKTHDRYFYPSDVLAIAYGFYFPSYFYIALAANLISFFTYEPFLFNTNIFPQTLLALALLIVIIIVVHHVILTLYKPDVPPKE
jgi:Gpi18-like mannosyltransferase